MNIPETSGLSVGNWIDMGAGIFLLYLIIRGAFKGPIREMLTVVGLVISFAAAATLYRSAYSWSEFDFFTGNTDFGHLGWFGIILIGLLIFFRLTDLILKKFTQKTGGMSLTTRLWGSGIAMGKGIVTLMIVAMTFLAIPISTFGLDPVRKQAFESSVVLTSASQNRWLLGWIEQTAILERARSFVLGASARAIALGLLPPRARQDEEIQAKAIVALTPILSDPEVLDRLVMSPTARDTETAFRTHPAFAHFLATNPIVLEASQDGKVTLGDLRRIFNDPVCRQTLDALLLDPAFLDLVRQAPIREILTEVESQKSG
ncbi:MAG: CvpA family protein [Planctomycetota bacterium]|jgi:uncharacterized membrane protein required for colicin V production|nr:CvpA family protein [Planctomycetota bacterium]